METTKVLQGHKVHVPKLRFKEFKNEWNLHKLSSFINFISGYAFNSSEMKSTKSRYQLIKMSNVYKSELDLDRSPSYWDQIDSKLEKFLLRKKDILLTLTGTVGKQDYGYSVVIPEDNKFLLNQRLVCLRFIPNVSEGDFINNLIKTSRFYYLFFGESKGGTGNQSNVGSEDLKNIKLSIPSLSEQQKIASFLFAVDEKIKQLTHKKELLDLYKKGVMQQLFSGKLRFNDINGKAFPKWEMVGGNKLFDSISDKKHNSDLPILAITQDQGAIPREMINYQMSVTDSSIASYKVVQVGDFIISLRTFQGGIEYSNYKGICSPAYNILRPSSDNVNRDFYKYYFKTSYYIMQLQKNLEGIRDGKMISYKYFSEIKLPFPSKEEQKKIANYLSIIDNKIESINKQITQTQTFKKGLLQQMFV